jgi:hypothetical protein
MKLSEADLFDYIQAIVATVAEKDVTNKQVIEATEVIVELIKQDREVRDEP